VGRRYALMPTVYEYLYIEISEGPSTFRVELIISDNGSNKIVLPRATWRSLVKKRANVRFLQSIAAPSLSARDLLGIQINLLLLISSIDFIDSKSPQSII